LGLTAAASFVVGLKTAALFVADLHMAEGDRPDSRHINIFVA
jgi:hypothetical protein